MIATIPFIRAGRNKLAKVFTKRTLMLFAVIIGLSFMNRFNFDALIQDICHGGITWFEARHCGGDNHVPGSRTIYNVNIDVTLEPATLLAPYIYRASGVYDDLHYKFHNNGISNIFWPVKPNEVISQRNPLFLTFSPWYTADIFTYEEKPTAAGGLLPLLVWSLNITYWLALAALANYLWQKNKIGKGLVIFFIVDKTILTIGIVFVVFFLSSFF